MAGPDKNGIDKNNPNNIQVFIDLVNTNIALSKQPTIELLKRCVRVDQEKVAEIGNTLAETYLAPRECVERLNGYEVYEVPDGLFVRMAYEDIVQNLYKGVDAFNKMNKQELEQAILLFQKAEAAGGVCDTKLKRMYVRKDVDVQDGERTIKHEILHAMADIDESNSGFDVEGDTESHADNEATVEVLEMAHEFGLGPTELVEAILDGKINNIRKKRVLFLLTPFMLTEGGENELRFVDLAKHYWNKDREGLIQEMQDKMNLNEANINIEKMDMLRRIQEAVT